MNLCVNCKYYEVRESELFDACSHPKSTHGGVRSIVTFTCKAMRAGICYDGQLFEPKEKTA